MSIYCPLSEALGIKSNTSIMDVNDDLFSNDVYQQNVKYARLGTKVWTGQHHTPETKEIISKKQSGVAKSQDHCKSLSEAAKKRYLNNPLSHPMYGKKGHLSPSFGVKKGPPKKAECPYCKKMVAINNIMRYHYENCKWK